MKSRDWFNGFCFFSRGHLLILCLLVNVTSEFIPMDTVLLGANPPTEPQGSRPWFDARRIHNVTAQLHRAGFLTCHICSLGNDTVSWLRHSDAQLLTVGRNVYTSDSRFSVLHPEGSDEWTLKIAGVRHEDAGMYACQISSASPVSFPLFLSIAEPETEILGGPEVFVDALSAVNLTCVVRKSPKPPAAIFWKHNQQTISYNTAASGVSIVTVRGEVTASQLLIRSASADDSGYYLCQPVGAPQGKVKVHVLDGESPAAMQTSSSSPAPGAVFISALCWLSTSKYITLIN